VLTTPGTLTAVSNDASYVSVAGGASTEITPNSSGVATTITYQGEKYKNSATTITVTFTPDDTTNFNTATNTFTVSQVTRHAGYVRLNPANDSDIYGTISKQFIVESYHGGALTADESTNTDATVSISGTTVTVDNISGLIEGTEVRVTVTSAQTDIYEEASAEYVLTIRPATIDGDISVAGNTVFGQTLSVATNITPAGCNLTDYQWWIANDENGTGKTNISGATNSTLTLTADHIGKYIGVTLTANKENFTSKSFTSDPVGPVVSARVTTDPTATNRTYNGHTQIGVPEGTGYSLTGTASAINQGSYNVTATLDTGYVWSDGTSGTKSFTWSISPLAVTVTWENVDSFEYNASSQVPTASIPSNVGTGETLGGLVITTSPTPSVNVGSYTATVASFTVTGGQGLASNYSLTPATKEYTITKATAGTPVLEGSSKTYDGTPGTVTVTTAGTGGTLQYASSTESASSGFGAWTTTVPTRIDAGTTWVKARREGDDNYNRSSESNVVTIVVNKASRTLSIPATKALTYGTDGNITFSYLPEAEDVTATIKTNSNATVATATMSDETYGGTVNLHPLKAGSTVVTIRIPESTNYQAVEGSCTVTVNRAAGFVTLNETDGSEVQGASSATFTVTNSHGGTLTAVEEDSNYGIGIALSRTTATTANPATVTLTGISELDTGTVVKIRVTSAETEQYTAASTLYTLTIGEAITGSVTITGTTTYNQILTAVPTTEPAGSTYTYQWWIADDSSGTNKQNISGKTNSTLTLDSASYLDKYIGVTVEARNGELTPKTFNSTAVGPVARIPIAIPTANTGLIYTGSSQRGVNPGTGYTLSGSQTGTDATSYTAIASLVTGYRWSTTDSLDAQNINWSIGKKEVTVTWQDVSSFEYNGSNQAPTASVPNSVITGETLGTPTVTVTPTPNKDVGSYTATATLTTVTGGQADPDNYKLKNDTKAFTITVTTPGISLSPKEATYTGSAIAIDNATVTGVSASDKSNGTITYTYYTDSNCNTLTTTTSAGSGAATAGGAPKNVGTYYVKATIAPAGNYGTATSSAVQLKINKATPTLELSPSNASVNYMATGSFTATTTAVPNAAGTLTAVSNDTNYVTITSGASTSVTATSAGAETNITYQGAAYTNSATTITITFTPSDTRNFNSATAEFSVSQVNRVEPTITLADKTATYTGSAITIGGATVTGVGGTVSNGAITYKYYSDSTCNTEIAAPVNVGTYYAKATIAAAGNYASATSNVATLTIEKATPSITLTPSSEANVVYHVPKSFIATTTAVPNATGTLTAVSNDIEHVSITAGASTSNVNATSAGTETTISYQGEKYKNSPTTITVTFTPDDTANFNTATQTFSVARVDRAPGYVTLSRTTDSAEFGTTGTKTFTVTSHHGGTLTAVQTSSTVATVSLSGTTITVGNLSTLAKDTDIIIEVTSSDTDYYAEASATYTLTVGDVIVGEVNVTGTPTFAQQLATQVELSPEGCVIDSYQWWIAEDSSGTNKQNISGKTSSTLTLDSASYLDKYIGVTIVVSNGELTPQTFHSTAVGPVARIPIAIPTANKGLIYTGGNQVGVAGGTGYQLTGTASDINAGDYTAIATLETGYEWIGGSTAVQNINWSIAKKEVAVTWQNVDSFVYNGSNQAPTASVPSSVITGETLGTPTVTVLPTPNKDVGSYTAKATLTTVTGGQANPDNYKLTNDTKAFTITKKLLTKPTIVGTYTYTGSPLTATFDANFDDDIMTASNNIQTNAGDYNVTVSLNDTDNYAWDDGTANGSIADLSVPWTIGNATMSGSVKITGTNTFGNTLTATMVNLDPSDAYLTYKWFYSENNSTEGGIEIVGATTNTLKLDQNVYVGKYIYVEVTATKTNYNDKVFKDITDPTENGTAQVAKAQLPIPTYTGSNVYKGSNYTIIPTNFDDDTMNITGNVQKNQGNYTMTISLDNTTAYEWSDHTITNKTIDWSITPKPVAVIWGTTTSFVYDGQPHAPTASAESGIAGETITLTRTTGIDVDEYTSVASISAVEGGNPDNYTLTNSTKDFEITKRLLTKPNIVGTYTYTGSPLTAEFDANFDDDIMTASNHIQTDAGNYNVIVSLNDPDNNAWDDGTASGSITNLSIPWTIGEAAITGSVTITGTNTYGNILTANVTTNPTGCTLTYQWYASDDAVDASNPNNVMNHCTAITEERSSNTYAVGSGLADKYIYVVVKATKDNYATTYFADRTDESNGTATVAKASRTITIPATKTLTYGTDGSIDFSYLPQAEDVTATIQSNSNATVATANLTDGTYGGSVTLHPLKQGTTTVTVTIPESMNYQAVSGSCEVTVNRATGFVELSLTEDSVEFGTASTTFTVTDSHGGALSVEELTTTVATVSISGTTVTIEDLETLPKDTVVRVKVTSATTDQYTEAYKIYELTIGDTITGSVSITGIPRFNETLIADTSEISPEGFTPTYHWWYADDNLGTNPVSISESSDQLVLDQGEYIGKYIFVTVDVENDPLTPKTFTSAGVGPVVRIQIANVPTGENHTYNGLTQTGLESTAAYRAGGEATGIDAGNYTATATPNTGYEWSNGDTTARNVTWNISPKAVDVIWGPKTSFVYDGQPQAPTAEAEPGENGEVIHITRTTGIDVNEYTSVASITSVENGQANPDNYTLTNSTKDFEITKQLLDKPEVTGGPYYYDATPQTVQLTNWKEGKMTASNNVQTEAGTYTVIVSLVDTHNYAWNDGTANGSIADVELEWVIEEGYKEYTVNHYIHNIGAETYTLYDSETKEEIFGRTIIVDDLKTTIPGFTYEGGYVTGDTTKPTGDPVTTTSVLLDNSREINLYYRRNYLYIQYNVNGGTLSSTHGTGYGVYNDLATYTGNTPSNKFLRGVYGGKVGELNINTYAVANGLDDYNNPLGFNLENAGYIASVGNEWNTNAEGTGTSYHQEATDYEVQGFAGADLRTGDATVVLYVNWVPQEYTITYHLDGGTNGAGNPRTYTLESSDIVLTAPTKTGYEFIGWNGSNGDTPQTSVTIAHGSTGDKEYTANWTPIEYDITYHTDGGTMTGQKTSYNIETETFTLVTPTKENYEFLGWTGSNGETPETMVTITMGSIGDKEYTAHWSKITKTILDIDVYLEEDSHIYTGEEITPEVVVTHDGVTLVEGTDYDIVYEDNVDVGTATITITGKGDYEGEVTKVFTILPRPVTITSNSRTKVYDGTALSDSGKDITEGSLATGHTYTATVTGTITNVGSVENVISNVVIRDASNNVVTANYDVTIVNGTLTVTIAQATLTVNPTEKQVIVKGNSFSGTYSSTGDGEVTLGFDNPGIASINATDGHFTIKGTETGNTTLVVTLETTQNYQGAQVTLEVEVLEANYSITKDGNTTYYYKLEDAVEVGGTIKVERNVNDVSTSVVIDKTVILDLGDYTVVLSDTPIEVVTNGKLTIIGDEDGKLKNEGESTIINTDGFVRIGDPNGTIKDYPTIEGDTYAITGDFTFDGGTLVGSHEPPYNSHGVTLTRPYSDIETTKNGDVYESRVIIEKVPPVIQVEQDITTPTNGDVTLTVTVTDNLSGVKEVTYEIDGEEYVLTLINDVGTIVVSENSTIIIHAEDRAGNTSSLEHQVTNIDKDAENVTNVDVEGMTNGTVTDTLVILENIKTTDDEDVTHIIFSNTNTAPSADDAGWIPFSTDMKTPWDLDNSDGNGEKTVYAWAKDEAGNISTTPYELKVTLDTRLIGGEQNKIVFYFVGYDKNLSKSKSALSNSNMKYQINGTEITAGSSNVNREDNDYLYKGASSIKFSSTLTNVKGDGRLDVSIDASTLYDKAGNTNIAKTPTLETDYYIDTYAPEIEIDTNGNVTVTDRGDNLAAVTVNGVLVSRDGNGISAVNVNDVVKAYDKAGNVATMQRVR